MWKICAFNNFVRKNEQKHQTTVAILARTNLVLYLHPSSDGFCHGRSSFGLEPSWNLPEVSLPSSRRPGRTPWFSSNFGGYWWFLYGCFKFLEVFYGAFLESLFEYFRCFFPLMCEPTVEQILRNIETATSEMMKSSQGPQNVHKIFESFRLKDLPKEAKSPRKHHKTPLFEGLLKAKGIQKHQNKQPKQAAKKKTKPQKP